MKKNVLLLGLAIFFSSLFVSCSKDENPDDFASIEGTWYYDGFKYFEFNADGTGEIAGMNETEEILYAPMRWSLNGDVLTITILHNPASPFTTIVKKLNDTTLVLHWMITEEDETYTFDMTYTRN